MYQKSESAWSFARKDNLAGDHFRIRDMLRPGEATFAIEDERPRVEMSAPEPTQRHPIEPPRPVWRHEPAAGEAYDAPVHETARAAAGIAPYRPQPGDMTSALHEQYEGSIQNIEQNIFGVAAAVTALDSIEEKLSQARGQIEILKARGEPVDYDKVERALRALADHVRVIINRLDERHVNLLRDARFEVRFVELDDGEDRTMGVDLTLISLEKLVAYKLRDGTRRPEETIALIDQMAKVVHHNTHVLSSMILALFASRDYTEEVARLVLSGRSSRRTEAMRQLAAARVAAAEGTPVQAGQGAGGAGHVAGNGGARWPDTENGESAHDTVISLIERVRMRG
ncbi:MAG: hypothetical protein R3D33_09540 [Hyphomicrobiaceae bacterium]